MSFALEWEVCMHTEEEEDKKQQPYRNMKASASTLSAQGKHKCMYEKNVQCLQTFSPFPIE